MIVRAFLGRDLPPTANFHGSAGSEELLEAICAMLTAGKKANWRTRACTTNNKIFFMIG
jgi:hypothetical protein